MAQRPIYIPQTEGEYLVQTDMVDFKWFAGMAVSQKQKSIHSLHEATLEKHKNLTRILEKARSAYTTPNRIRQKVRTPQRWFASMPTGYQRFLPV